MRPRLDSCSCNRFADQVRQPVCGHSCLSKAGLHSDLVLSTTPSSNSTSGLKKQQVKTHEREIRPSGWGHFPPHFAFLPTLRAESSSTPALLLHDPFHPVFHNRVSGQSLSDFDIEKAPASPTSPCSVSRPCSLHGTGQSKHNPSAPGRPVP